MATSQPWNAGGLLAGIGGVNANAPQASDVNSTLALIRGNNELERAGANNIGLQALQGAGGVAQAYQQEAQQQAQAAFNQAHAQAWKTGDTSILRQFAAQNPSFVDQAQKAVSHLNEEQRADIGSLAAGMRVSLAQGPQSFSKFVNSNAEAIKRVGADPDAVLQVGVSDPQQAQQFVDTLGMSSLGGKDYFDAVDKRQGKQIDAGRLQETIRSNQAGEALQSRGQDIQIRGQDISAATARRGQDMAMQRSGAVNAGPGSRQVQLADGRTVSVSGKLHGAGQNAFYEGIDANGNMVRVPASAISAPPSSAASAQNFAMKQDLDALSSANTDDLGFLTGVTGGNGNPALGADYRSRWNGKEQRQLYNSAQRIQGRMQNQGIAAARDMGASGINTVAEAKMYFQGMPQIDFSSPQSLQSSIQNIRSYTDNYNQQYDVNLPGKSRSSEPGSTSAQPQAQSGGYQSLWGD